MGAHANLTGADLHESKGVSTAAANTVAVADGAGSTAFSKIGSSSINTSSIFNTNVFFLTARFPDIGTVSSIYVPIPANCTLNTITTATQSAVTGADTILTVANYALSTIGTVTIALATAAAGDVDTFSASVNNTFLSGTFLKITTDGGATNSVETFITLKFTWTS